MPAIKDTYRLGGAGFLSMEWDPQDLFQNDIWGVGSTFCKEFLQLVLPLDSLEPAD